MKMICITFLLIFIISFSEGVFGTVNVLKGKKSWDGEKACGSYFLRELFRLFADEKIDQRIQGVYNKLKKELSKQKESKIAFTAGLAKSETYSNNAVLKFTKVITNVGGGLNSTDGVFYCPEPGLYSFFVNVMAYTTGSYATIYKDDTIIMYIHTGHGGSNTWRSGSNQVILQLKKGDKVSVKSDGSTKFHPNSSHFSGNKL